MTIIAKAPRWGPVILAAIVLYLGVQLAITWRNTHRSTPTSGPGAQAEDTAWIDTASTERLVSRALGQIPPPSVDSTEIKTGWREDVRGIELAAFTPRQRELFLRMANAEACTCGCGF